MITVGFTKGGCPEQVVGLLRELILKNSDEGKPLVIVVSDILIAFDAFVHEILEVAFERQVFFIWIQG